MSKLYFALLETTMQLRKILTSPGAEASTMRIEIDQVSFDGLFLDRMISTLKELKVGQSAVASLRIAGTEIFPSPTPMSERPSIEERCVAIADRVEPGYRMYTGREERSCTGHYAKRWQAAYDAALIVMAEGGNNG